MNLSRRRIENLKVFRLFSHHTLSRLSINKIAKSKEIILTDKNRVKRNLKGNDIISNKS
jgi:hypothetical protein